MSCRMTSLQIGLLLGASVCCIIFLGHAEAQAFGEQCLDKFKKGRDDFVLDTNESVKDGATFISSVKVERSNDCIRSCCKDPRCNVAFMEVSDEGMIKSCFLFDCLYKQSYVCRFVRKKGFQNYIIDSVYASDLATNGFPDEEDHPPVANGGPDRVAQPQESLTLNGIESKDDHEIVTYQWHLVSGNSSAVIEKTQFDDQVIVSKLTSGVYKFQLTVTDSSGQSDQTQITILVLTPEQSEDHCLVPKKVGPCRGSFPRWHYNAASEKCEEFLFGGCRENLNNYLSLQECTNACDGVSVMSSVVSGRSGPLPAPREVCGIPCRSGQFTCANSCCLDQGLECDKEQQCSDGSDEENCEYLNDKFRILLQIPVDEQKVRCTVHPKTGHCRDSFTKWYYNPLYEKCFRFNYGGCDGNDNRFDTEDTCMTTCKLVTEKDIFERKESFEYQDTQGHTGSIAIAALLGLAIIILLVVLCYCFMKGRKKQPQRQRVPINGTQVHTKEDTERLVYNSTTKSI
ncbi:kunitz-type protease inhibitor 1 isoform X2 [Oncorhynchus mykiss]|uniref:Serine peptidase inhibitor, Kunitz type 1 a n=2 Tax=Oncorhynchus mykiss TaxID=8022 RepID=A0A8C7RVW4_ONCMY|nr:kunitz-type protease inhibitor 1 isoform X2 [Oncorhynchus mykiss]